MIPKEHFWSGLKGGIFDEKHRKAMGPAIWLFGWLVTRQTQVNGNQEGLPYHGHPLLYSEIVEDTGYSKREVRRWTARLVRAGYIRIERRGNSGLVYFILNAKDKAKVRPQMATHGAKVRPKIVTHGATNGRTYARNPEQNESVPKTPTILGSTDLSYYNKEKLSIFSGEAKTQPLELNPSLKELRKEIKTVTTKHTVPRNMGHEEIEQRRQFLRNQADQMLRRKEPTS